MKKLSIIPLSIYLLMSGCTKNLTGLNSNPKAATNVPSGTLFVQGEKDLVDIYTTTSVSVAPFRVVAQSWTENTYVAEAQYNFTQYQAPDGYWTALYNAIAQFEAAKAAYPNDVKDPVAMKNDFIITDILEVYAYNLLVTTYGNIPYSQAENRNIPFPKYDDAKTVFYDLLSRLDTSIADINTTGTLTNGDLIYAGSANQLQAWKTFAATLKLKMSMIIADIDPTTANKKVGEAIATGVFQSDADDALLTYDASVPTNSNPLWQALVYSGRHDFDPANLLVNTMVGWNDPRLSLYFTKDPNGNYTGGAPGESNGYGIFSDFTPTIQTPTYPGDILDYSQTQFLLAEAAARGFTVPGSAATYYNNAITASIEFWGGTAAQAATYLLQPTVAYATAAGTWQQKIGYQQWIAFYNGNWDAWTIIRRLHYPDIDVVNPPVQAESTYPLRFTYPTNEVTANPVNWAAGQAALPGGKDVVTAKLFFMP